MIDVKELRINNLFKGYDGKILKWALSDFTLLERGIEIDEIVHQPIPLTEEILLKCGIEIDGSFGHIKNFESIYLLKPWVEADHFLLKIIGGECIGKIKYLHQLQNLYFSLIGQELEML